LEVRSRTPFAYDYERIEGTVHYAVAPEHPANRAIVDLDKAPRGADGRVAYAADFCLLQPADPARGNGGLIVDVPNRGRKVAVRQLNRAPNEAIPTPERRPRRRLSLPPGLDGRLDRLAVGRGAKRCPHGHRGADRDGERPPHRGLDDLRVPAERAGQVAAARQPRPPPVPRRRRGPARREAVRARLDGRPAAR